MVGKRDRRGDLLLLLGAVFANLLLLCIWLWWAFGTHNGFADLTVDMLKDPAVRSVAAEQVVDALEQQGMTSQVALAAGPALEPVVASVVGTDAFKGLVYAGARQLHEAIFVGNSSRLLVEVNDAGPMVKDSLRVVNPGLADSIPDSALDIAVGVSQNTRLDALIHAESFTGWLIWPLSALTLLCFGIAVARVPDRRRAVLRLGLLLVASGVLWFVTLVAAVAVVSRFVDGAIDRAALRAVFRAVTHVLMLSTRVVLNTGIVITLAALVAGEERVRSKLRTAALWIRLEWDRPVLHGLLGTLIVVIGLLVTVYPEVVLALTARTVGLLLAFVGLVAVLDVLGAYGWSAAGTGAPRSALRHVAVIGTATATSIVLLLAFGGVTLYRSLNMSHLAQPDTRRGCNGHVELCDRRLDQVVLAGTHNAMSASTEKGWFFARQTGGIGAQLSRGVRAFLLDAHYGTRIGGTVRTDFVSEAEQQTSYAELTADQRAVLGRLLGLIGLASPPASSKKVFLCHLFCELGATPAIDTFRKIDGFLAANPNEVVVIVIEDHVSPGDVDRLLQQSGLAERAHAYTPGHALPTLGDMIRTKRNVLVMAEQHGDAPWYSAGYDRLLQDTPYSFETTADFSCTMNRGRSTNALLLLNHWISVDPASSEVAAKVNARQVLLDRVADCRTQRGRLPNIIAVDFYAAGNLFDVVDELNGVTKAGATAAVTTLPAVPTA